MTLPEAVDLALKQNPEIVMARFDEQKAQEAIREARDPFTTKVVVGSGLAYSSGFPMSIDGSAPSIFQARAIQSLYNKPKSYEVSAARENARISTIDTAARRDEIAHRTAVLYLQAERAARGLEIARQQVASFSKVAGAVQARVQEGRELPVEERKANLRISQARQRVEAFEADLAQAEMTLAIVLGMSAEDRVQTVAEERTFSGVPLSEAEAVETALANSNDIRRLQSTVQVRTLEARSARASRLPVVDLVAQYGLFARFNNYEDFFQRFQRHNGQLGMSFQLPLFSGGGSAARATQADIAVSRLRVEIAALHNRVAADTRTLYGAVRRAETGRAVAKEDLDVTREQLSVGLAQLEEGRATLRQIEELRAAETEKWLAFYDAQHVLERARLDLLRQTGTIVASIAIR